MNDGVDLDPTIAARFAGLDEVAAPDTWDQALERSQTDRPADRSGGARLLLAAAVVLLLGGAVLAVALVSDRRPDDVVPVDTTPPTVPSSTPSTVPSTVSTSADGYAGTTALETYLRRLPRGPSPRWTHVSPGGDFSQMTAAGDVIAYRAPGDRTGVVGVARSDGRELWRVDLDANGVPGVVQLERVDGAFVATVFGPDGSTFVGIDPPTGEVLWELADGDDAAYVAFQGSFINRSGVLRRISGRTGEVVRSIPLPPDRAVISSNGVRLGWIDGTVVSVFDAVDFNEVVPPTDLGVAVDEVVDSGNTIMAFEQSEHRLLVFDRNGSQLAALDMEAPERADDQSSQLWDVIADRPTVVRVSARGQEVVEFADGELRLVASYDYRDASFSYVDGRTLIIGQRATDPDTVDVVDITARRVVYSGPGLVEAMRNGLVTYRDDLVSAVSFDGEPMWPDTLSVAIAASQRQLLFVDGGVVVQTELNGAAVAMFWE